MAWVSYDDQFTDAAIFYGVPYPARWHYFALVGRISNTRQWHGRLPRGIALRVSDVPEPEAALADLVAAGLLKDYGDEVEVVMIDDHIPPEGQRPDVMLPRKKVTQQAYRNRQCAKDAHSKDCPPKTCPVKLAKRSTQGGVASALPGNAGIGIGSGRVGKSPSETNPALEEEVQVELAGEDACRWCKGKGCPQCIPGWDD